MKAKSLWELSSKVRREFLNRVDKLVGPEGVLATLDANPDEEQCLREAFPKLRPLFVYDAKTICGILGFPNNCKEKVPKPAAGEVVVWYDGWTLGELVATGKVVNLLPKELEAWQAPAGYYHTRIPVPNSNRMTYDERTAYRKRLYAVLGELPVPIGATALAVHLAVTGEDLLKGNCCVCAETLPHGVHAALYVREGLVRVDYYWDGRRGDYVFGGGARKS